jgi:hypothetical protein
MAGRYVDVAAKMEKHLRANNKLVSLMSTKYMYINEDLGWVLVNSATAARKICEILGFYAPVNYMTSAKPIIESLLNTPAPSVVLGPTFSQGRVRCHFYKSVNKEGRTTHISLEAAVPLNMDEFEIDKNILYTSKSSFCISPVKTTKFLKKIAIPKSLKLNNRGNLCKWIYDVFEENSEAVLWAIGDMFTDYGTKRMFIFYGPGGVGTTSVVNIICSIGSNVLVQIPGRFKAKKGTIARNYGNSLPEVIKATLPNTRLALVSDVEVTSDDEHLNVQTVKELTGGDEGPHGRVSVTSIMSLNKLFSYEFQGDYTLADRTRHVTVIPTVLKRSRATFSPWGAGFCTKLSSRLGKKSIASSDMTCCWQR